MHEFALLIRDQYEELYSFLTQRSSLRLGYSYSGNVVTGHPGIGQLQLYCISQENRLMVMYRQVALSAMCAPSPLV